MKIYVASRWRALRAAGVPIVASWISSSPRHAKASRFSSAVSLFTKNAISSILPKP